MELAIDHLTKQYKDKTAVQDVCLTLTPGIWGLLGANGAGKTTLMRMIAGILTPTGGEVRYNGINISTLGEGYRDVFGYLPQTFGFYPEFTVSDYLHYIAALKGIPKAQSEEKIDDLLHTLTLFDVKKKRIHKLSGGMQRRVGIAQALLNDPDVLILDEPTSGLDPGERVRFRNLLSGFAQNRIILISTHIVSDVEYIATRNAILKDGQIVGVGPIEELLHTIQDKVFTATIPAAALPAYAGKTRIVNVRDEGEGLATVRYVSDTADIPGSATAAPRLEDLYLWLFREQPPTKEETECA